MWPFAVWGLDMVGPFWKALGGYDHLLVAVDKFSKWIKVKPIAQNHSEDAVEFFLDIVYCFGVLNCIMTDNWTQFTRKKFLLQRLPHPGRLSLNRAPPNQRASRACQWHGPAGPKAAHLQPPLQVHRVLGRRVAGGTVEPAHEPKPIHRVHSLLHGVWHEAVLPTDLDYGAPRVQAYDENR
ncbi:uncharacterized protein LOC112900524 [Panicum hallii]|jgi:hypothetical protein|uniref:uncharacterized protein LOC112900524 n=1 Tax=Panicum hallii TaxID=206008 RepID=UPI000DF4E825|nr:uncharacterized protein LOC112900524 [Panicum hallii]